ncbi:MAG: membrane protein insertase YidC [Gemmatimonadales bacterium]|jgi:YidC/Oxa1 family membrane protein insertase|nr:MAG: membrane protein insertase YidC [Gemmatimonadales bacterium]
MRTEIRLLLAVGLMILVMVGTNLLFPPAQPEPGIQGADSVTAPQVEQPAGSLPEIGPAPATEVEGAGAPAEEAAVQAVARQEVVVESPLYRYTFDNYGAAATSVQLLEFESLVADGGEPVELVPEGTRALQGRVVVGRDTLDLSRLGFTVDPAEGLSLRAGDGPRTLTFRYSNGGAFGVEVAYTFRPDDYVVDVSTRVSGVERPLLFTSLGEGLALNEADSDQEARELAYVGNHLNEGIDDTRLDQVEERILQEGPFRWVAFRSRYFVSVILPGLGEEEALYLGGLIATPSPAEFQAGVSVAHPLAVDGVTHYRVFMGPQVYATLQSLGEELEEVNPYGWAIFRPILRPIVAAILWVLNFLHDTLSIGYGWVLILFGVLMRVVLWPLNQKAMRSQMKNMAVQPLMKEIQTKYKDNPEKLQKEMMKLYKEHGFNPLGGCLPMLIPFPVLIALFFVFRNTIELRGVPFLWLPDLAAKDPLYILPLALAVSMFLLQWISLRSMPESNPQMRMMMWFMPVFMGFIFLQFPSGLNLYYATANVATLPQQVLIARERKKVKILKPKADPGSQEASGSPSGPSEKRSGKRKGRKKR